MVTWCQGKTIPELCQGGDLTRVMEVNLISWGGVGVREVVGLSCHKEKGLMKLIHLPFLLLTPCSWWRQRRCRQHCICCWPGTDSLQTESPCYGSRGHSGDGASGRMVQIQTCCRPLLARALSFRVSSCLSACLSGQLVVKSMWIHCQHRVGSQQAF